MTTHLYLAPAGHGKTTCALERIRQTRAADPLTPIIVILPNQAQVNAFRRRLSASGGALGVKLGTFYALPTQLAVLKLLAERAAETIITLTGDPPPFPQRHRPALRRFTRALQAVREALALEPEPLPAPAPPQSILALTHLETNL
jgi:hypothetical protein